MSTTYTELVQAHVKKVLISQSTSHVSSRTTDYVTLFDKSSPFDRAFHPSCHAARSIQQFKSKAKMMSVKYFY
jgi:hypothetical protein